MVDEVPSGRGWYAVRCIFQAGRLPETAGWNYEERITLWHADSAEEAIERAEAEALEYAACIQERPDTYLGIAQSYWMHQEPVEGAELFSLIRVSELQPEQYLTRFFDTGQEYQRSVESDDPAPADPSMPGPGGRETSR